MAMPAGGGILGSMTVETCRGWCVQGDQGGKEGKEGKEGKVRYGYLLPAGIDPRMSPFGNGVELCGHGLESL